MLKGQVVPVFRIFDLDKALEFYVGFLGFKEDWRHRFAPDMPVYLQVSKDGVVLHLSEHHGDATPGARARIEVDDIDGLCTALNAKGYRYLRPAVRDTEWGSRELPLKDPFGNELTIWVPAKKPD
jgi:catechol 2,3-dioxygenase-like lactoylglutathione lyase family enzyme